MATSPYQTKNIDHVTEVNHQVGVISDALTANSKFKHLGDISVDADVVIASVRELGDSIINEKPTLNNPELIGVLHEAVKRSFDEQISDAFMPSSDSSPRHRVDEAFVYTHAAKYQEELYKVSLVNNTLPNTIDDRLYYGSEIQQKQGLAFLTEKQSDYLLQSIKPYSVPVQQNIVKDIVAKNEWVDQTFSSSLNTARDSAAEFADALDRVGMPSYHLTVNLFPDSIAMNATSPPAREEVEDLMFYVRGTQVFHDAQINFRELEEKLDEVYGDISHRVASTDQHKTTSILHNALDTLVQEQMTDRQNEGVTPLDIKAGLQEVAVHHYGNLSNYAGNKSQEFILINPIYSPVNSDPLPDYLTKGEYERIAGAVASYPQGTQQHIAERLDFLDDSEPFFHARGLEATIEQFITDFNKDVSQTSSLRQARNDVDFNTALESTVSRLEARNLPQATVMPASGEPVITTPSISAQKEADFELNHQNIQRPDHVVNKLYAFSKAIHSMPELESIAMTPDDAEKTLRRFLEGGPDALPEKLLPSIRDNIMLDQLERQAEKIEMAAITNSSVKRADNSLDGAKFADDIENGRRPLGRFFDEVAKMTMRSEYLPLGRVNPSDNSVNPYPIDSRLTEKEHLATIVAMKDTLTAGERQSALGLLRDKSHNATDLKGTINTVLAGVNQLDRMMKDFANNPQPNYSAENFSQAVVANRTQLSKADLQKAADSIEFVEVGRFDPSFTSYSLNSDIAAAKKLEDHPVSEHTRDQFSGISKHHEQLMSDIRSINPDTTPDMRVDRITDSANQLINTMGRFSESVEGNIDIKQDINTLLAYGSANKEVSKMLDDIESEVKNKGLDNERRDNGVDLESLQTSKYGLKTNNEVINNMAMHKQGINLPREPNPYPPMPNRPK